MQVWLPASLSVIPNTAFLRRVSTPLADVTAWYSPRFRAGRDEMSACVKSIGTTGKASAVTLRPGGSYSGGRADADKASTLPVPEMMPGMLGAELGS